jgi:hypothetical protein
MTLADDILSLVTRKPGLTEAEIAKHLFGRLGYQQRVNSTCRRLIRERCIERRGNGGPGHPFSYHGARDVDHVPKSAARIAFDVKPLKAGERWYIVATYPGGMQEQIPGFHSEAEAKEWLASKCQTWLRARGYAT